MPCTLTSNGRPTSPDLLRQSSESLARRIGYLKSIPFPLPEVLKDSNEPATLKKHWRRGGLRMTYVNRLRRAGVPREGAMRLVNHASDLVRQIHQREKVQDVERWRDAVAFPQ